MQKNPGVLDVKYNFEHKILKCYIYIPYIWPSMQSLVSMFTKTKQRNKTPQGFWEMFEFRSGVE